MKQFQLTLIFALVCSLLQAQKQADTLEYSINTRINAGSGNYAPFLSTANQYDRFSLTPNSFSAWTTLKKETSKQKNFDYGFGLELNTNLSFTEQRIFPGELYVDGKVGPFDIVLGMKREVFGNQDPLLSSGGMIGSQNSRPIPSLTIETNGYENVPFTKGFIEYWGGMANGIFSDETVTKNTLYHHKWLHVRLGGHSPITLNYGLHHVAQWAGSSPEFGTGVVNLDNFQRVFFGKSGGASSNPNDFYNALGNHIISKNLGLGFQSKNCKIDLYWQNIYEDGPVDRMNKAYNVEDGLWGISVRLPKVKPLHSFVVEMLSTTDQSGPWHDMDGVIYGGWDWYYNNIMYPNGYSFYGMTIGNPWLTSPKYNKNGTVTFNNNSVRMWYFSGLGAFNDFNYRLTGAFSKNFGVALPYRVTPKNQFSGQLEVFHAFPYLQNSEVSLGISGDRGSMYGNNVAILMGFRYTGLLSKNKKH